MLVPYPSAAEPRIPDTNQTGFWEPGHGWPVGTPVSVLVFCLFVPHTSLLCSYFLREERGIQGAQD